MKTVELGLSVVYGNREPPVYSHYTPCLKKRPTLGLLHERILITFDRNVTDKKCYR